MEARAHATLYTGTGNNSQVICLRSPNANDLDTNISNVRRMDADRQRLASKWLRQWW